MFVVTLGKWAASGGGDEFDENDWNIPFRQKIGMGGLQRQRGNHPGRAGFDQPLDHARLEPCVIGAIHGHVADDDGPFGRIQRLLDATHEIEIVGVGGARRDDRDGIPLGAPQFLCRPVHHVAEVARRLEDLLAALLGDTVAPAQGPRHGKDRKSRDATDVAHRRTCHSTLPARQT